MFISSTIVIHVQRGGMTPPLSLHSPTLDPSLGLKNCPKSWIVPPLNILSIPTLGPPQTSQTKKNFLPLRGKSELYFWQPQYKEPWKLSKKHKKLKKKFISGKLPPSLFDLVRVPTLSPPSIKNWCHYPLPPLGLKIIPTLGPPPLAFENFLKIHPPPLISTLGHVCIGEKI